MRGVNTYIVAIHTKEGLANVEMVEAYHLDRAQARIDGIKDKLNLIEAEYKIAIDSCEFIKGFTGEYHSDMNLVMAGLAKARERECFLLDIIDNLTGDCLDSDFNEEWDSYKKAEAEINAMKIIKS